MQVNGGRQTYTYMEGSKTTRVAVSQPRMEPAVEVANPNPNLNRDLSSANASAQDGSSYRGGSNRSGRGPRKISQIK